MLGYIDLKTKIFARASIIIRLCWNHDLMHVIVILERKALTLGWQRRLLSLALYDVTKVPEIIQMTIVYMQWQLLGPYFTSLSCSSTWCCIYILHSFSFTIHLRTESNIFYTLLCAVNDWFFDRFGH